MTTDTASEPLTGARIRELREAAGLSQADLAGLSGLTRNTIQSAESGRRISRRSKFKIQSVFADLATPLTAINRIQAELAELKTKVEALAAEQAA